MDKEVVELEKKICELIKDYSVYVINTALIDIRGIITRYLDTIKTEPINKELFSQVLKEFKSDL